MLKRVIGTSFVQNLRGKLNVHRMYPVSMLNVREYTEKTVYRNQCGRLIKKIFISINE